MLRIAKEFDGEFALFVKDVRSGVRYTFNSATPMYLASTVKVAVLAELLRQVKQGITDLDEKIVIADDDLRDGSARSQGAVVGQGLTLRQLARQMMVYSDNTATDLLLKRVGVDRVNQGLKEKFPLFGEVTSMLEVRRRVYGNLSEEALSLSPQQVREVRGLKLLRARAESLSQMLPKTLNGNPEPWTVQDLQAAYAAYYASELNSGPMDAMGALLEAIAAGRLVSKTASKKMVEMMKRCKTGQKRLVGLLPADTIFAHKTGTQYRRACDVGIFYPSPERPIVVAVCVKDHDAMRTAERVMAKLGKATYEVLWQHDAAPELSPPTRQ